MRLACLLLFAPLWIGATEPPKQVFLPTRNFKSSFPYITGDTVREACTHILDPTRTFDPASVRAGDTIFVMYDYLSYFFDELHPKIHRPYILVNHHFFDQSDDPVPGLEKFGAYLDDKKLIAWFTHNIDRKHPKLHPLPIGIGNAFYAYGNKSTFDSVIATRQKANIPRRFLLYMNFSVHTYELERRPIYDFFKNQKFCTVAQTKPLKNYLLDLVQHKFVLSPRGNGLDCFRTWEALLMGCYPIVKSSTLDPLFENLPVVIINDWSQVTLAYLEKKYEELEGKEYRWEKLFMPYWINQIDAVKKQYLMDHPEF